MTNPTPSVSEIVRPLAMLKGGQTVTVVLRDGARVGATTSLVYVGDAAGVIAYDVCTRKAIPRDEIKGWIA